MKRAQASLVLGLTLFSLTGCVTAHDVTLAGVWDTEAANVLTNQKDVTAEVCGSTGKCVEAYRADQGLFFKFASEKDAKAEQQAGDDHMRGIFILRWEADASNNDKEYVRFVLDNAGQSGDYEPVHT